MLQNWPSIRKKLVIVFVTMFMVAGSYGWYQYTRQNSHLKKKKAAFVMKAAELIREFKTDTAGANKKFLEKIITVNGLVGSIDSTSKPVIIFLTGDGNISSVKCSMDSIYHGKYSHIKKGSTITIKGICAGGELLS